MKKMPLIVANWKTYIKDTKEAERLTNNLNSNPTNTEVVLCPSLVHLTAVKKAIGRRRIKLGLQNLPIPRDEIITGETLLSQVMSLNPEYVIVGHSERRQKGESNERIASKVNFAIKNKLTPIICVGEKSGEHRLAVLKTQIKLALSKIEAKELSKIVIAYEPVWSIGKGASGAMSPSDIHRVALTIRSIVARLYGREYAFSFRVLYGGGVEKTNAKLILREGRVNGLLIGGASVTLSQFNNILDNICNR